MAIHFARGPFRLRLLNTRLESPQELFTHTVYIYKAYQAKWKKHRKIHEALYKTTRTGFGHFSLEMGGKE